MRSNLLFVLVVCGVVVVGWGGGKNGQGTVSVSLPGSFRIEVTIDSNGGEIVVQDRNSTIYGARIKIEKGALNVPTNITLEEETSTDVQGERSLRFGPSGTTFTKPAPVSAPYTDELVQKYEIDPQEMLLVLDNGDDIVEVIQPTSVDTVGRKVNGEIDHFSVLKPIDHRILLLMRDPYAFIDGTPVPITVIFPQMSGSVPSPLIARSKTQTMITVGKGKLANVGKPGERTLFLLPGITASPTTYYYDEQQNRENQNDFSFLLRNDPAFSSMYDNVVFFKYPTGKSVEEVAKQFATLFRRFVPQGTRVDLLGHSLGCMVIRQAIEVEGISPSVEDVFFLSGPHEGGELAKLVTFFYKKPYRQSFC